MKFVSNILIIGSFSNGALENFYVDGFRKYGITISKYDIAKEYYFTIKRNYLNKACNKLFPNLLLKSLNDNLCQYISNRQFQVILVFKGMQLFPETIGLLKLHATILANYNPDHPFHFFSHGSGNKNVLDSIHIYDLYFTYATQISKQLKEMYKVTSYTIPFGYDNNNESTAVEFQKVENKILFIGSYDKHRAQILKSILNSDILIFGDSKWHTRNKLFPDLIKAYQNRSLFGNTYKNSVANAAGVINLMRKQNISEQSHNMRTFEVPGYKGVLISQRTEEQLSFFEENKEAIYFESIEELRSKILFLKKNPEIQTRIKVAGFKRCIKSQYSYVERSFQLLEIVNKYL